MNVRVRIRFKPPTEQDWQAMRSLAAGLTNNPESVRVSADDPPDWLVAEFTMATEAQYKALPKIERAIKFHAGNRSDARFSFPYTESERARADRRAMRRKARRREQTQAGKEKLTDAKIDELVSKRRYRGRR